MNQPETNLFQIRAYTAAFNAHDIDAALALCSPDMTNQGRKVGRTGIGLVLKDIFTRFPDVHMEDIEVVALKDQVVCRNTYAGTHRGVGMLPVDGGQMVGVPPNGRQFSVQHIHWYTLRDGLIIGHEACRDDVGMLIQLGLLPEPPAFVPPLRPELG